VASVPRDEETAQAYSPAELATPAGILLALNNGRVIILLSSIMSHVPLMTEMVCSVLEVAPPSRVRVMVSLLYSVDEAQVMV
jgi:hypothetical protein